MSRNKHRLAEPDDRPGSFKRKAVAPGYLRDLLQAKQHLKSVGLKAADTATSSSTSSTSSAAPAPSAKPGSTRPGPPAGQEAVYVPPTTLPLLFAQRKKFLQHSKLAGTPQPYRLNEEMPVGLLSLPEDVLVRLTLHPVMG